MPKITIKKKKSKKEEAEINDKLVVKHFWGSFIVTLLGPDYDAHYRWSTMIKIKKVRERKGWGSGYGRFEGQTYGELIHSVNFSSTFEVVSLFTYVFMDL